MIFQLEFAVLAVILMFILYLFITGISSGRENAATSMVRESMLAFQRTRERDRNSSILIRIWDPLVLLATRYVPALSPVRDRTSLQHRLWQAGKDYLTPETYLGTKGAAAILCACLYLGASSIHMIPFTPAYLVVAIVVGFFVPDIDLWEKTKERQKEIRSGFLRFLALAESLIKSGYPADEAFVQVADAIPSPFSVELLHTMDEIESAQRRRVDAYADLANHCGVPEVEAFVQTVVMHETLGSSIAESLESLKRELRSKEENELTSKLMTIQNRLNGPMVVSLISFIVLLLGSIAITFMKFSHGLL